MVSAKTKKGTKVSVSLCDDIGENKGGYYCEVYLDGIDDDPIDNFVIHADQLVCGDKNVEDLVREYVSGIVEY